MAAVAAAAVGAALWVTACSNSAPRSSLAETKPPGTAHRLFAAVPGPPATVPSVAPTTTTTIPPLLVEPGGGRRLFPGHRVVAFYGAAGDPALGVLGDGPPEQVWLRLAAQADRYSQPGVQVVPAYELVTYMADAAPGIDGAYAARIPDATIHAYLDVVEACHGLLILNIQPGRGNFLADTETLAPFLALPDVALGLDPEWELQPGQVPLQQIGHTTAGEINAVRLAEPAGHRPPPAPELLVVHQFTAQMVQDKPAVEPHPGLAVTFNMDGFGSQPNKLSKYAQLASDPRFALGFKLFYQRDLDLFSPSQVDGFEPPPNVVEYE